MRPDTGEGGGPADMHDLSRFVQAQEGGFAQALAEIRTGRKRSHWMWYIFPHHPVLGPRLAECAEAALGVEGRSAREIFGSPDDLKLRSCATLFACVSPKGSVFDRLLDKYFPAGRDDRTLRLMGIAPEAR